MYRIFLVFLLVPGILLAAPVAMQPEDSFYIETITDPTAPTTYYGELDGFPHTYQFLVNEAIDFTAAVSVRPDGNQDISLIVIKEELRGVSEIGRRAGQKQTWEAYTATPSKLVFTTGAPLSSTLENGVYRLEVSAPDNTGKYRLDIGDSSELSYGESVRQSIAMHGYFGVGYLGAVVAWQVWVPLLLLLLMGGYVYRRHYGK